MDLSHSPLLVDLYQLNMMELYLESGETGPAVFEFFFRRLPARRGFLLAAGLEQALDYLETLSFSADDLAWLKSTGRFTPRFLDYLNGFRFTGEVHAVAEGTAFSPTSRSCASPLRCLRRSSSRPASSTSSISNADRVESRPCGALRARQGVVDFGLRRAHGGEAGLLAARASYIAGFAGTATVLAERLFGIPSYGTMAHSFIEAHDNEAAAFADFARARPDHLTLLIDTYDTEAAARKVVALAPKLAAEGITIRAVRIDSGDLAALSRSVRTILDQGDLAGVTIFASGGLDEDSIAALIAAGAPIDGYGVGTSLTTSSDVPALDCAYKLQEYCGTPRRKQSEGKQTRPGRKQVWRHYADDGTMAGDVVSTADDAQAGEPLIEAVMRDGRRLRPKPTLTAVREHAARELERLPSPLRRLAPAAYPVTIADRLRRLAEETDAASRNRTQRSEGPA